MIMQYYIPQISKLIEQFEKLPGIGRKTAQRLAFCVIGMSKENAAEFAAAITAAKESVVYCGRCQNLSDGPVCPICANPARDASVICVVESPKDVVALEKTREYRGLYHVLHGAISPSDGIGPEEIKIKELISRLSDGRIQEIILATNPTIEGEATAMYLSRLIKPVGLKVTRLAYGIPVGGELEYADEITLARAIEGRREL